MLMTMLKRDLPDTYLFDLDGQIAGITMQDVRAVAGRLARLDKMASVCIGKPAVSQYIPETPQWRQGDQNCAAPDFPNRLARAAASAETTQPTTSLAGRATR